MLIQILLERSDELHLRNERPNGVQLYKKATCEKVIGNWI